MGEKVKIYDRLFDNPERGDHGKGEFLGEFEIIKTLDEDSYSERSIGKDDNGNLFLIDGNEVCGYGGGMRFDVYDLGLTAADVAPARPGQWIEDDISGIIKCSLCGNDAPLDTTGGGQYKSRFCPSCGARNEGGAR